MGNPSSEEAIPAEAKTADPFRVRTLVVDDVAIARSTTQLVLESKKDIQLVGTAADGFEALQQVRSLKPDLVVMDVMMPVMNGLETAKRLLEAVPSTRIIMISGDDSDEARQACGEAGTHGFVPKDRIYQELLPRDSPHLRLTPGNPRS